MGGELELGPAVGPGQDEAIERGLVLAGARDHLAQERQVGPLRRCRAGLAGGRVDRVGGAIAEELGVDDPAGLEVGRGQPTADVERHRAQPAEAGIDRRHRPRDLVLARGVELALDHQGQRQAGLGLARHPDVAGPGGHRRLELGAGGGEVAAPRRQVADHQPHQPRPVGALAAGDLGRDRLERGVGLLLGRQPGRIDRALPEVGAAGLGPGQLARHQQAERAPQPAAAHQGHGVGGVRALQVTPLQPRSVAHTQHDVGHRSGHRAPEPVDGAALPGGQRAAHQDHRLAAVAQRRRGCGGGPRQLHQGVDRGVQAQTPGQDVVAIAGEAETDAVSLAPAELGFQQRGGQAIHRSAPRQRPVGAGLDHHVAHLAADVGPAEHEQVAP